MVRVESNSSKRTHWWNRQSSSSTASPIPCSDLSITSLSLSPNLHSGVPERYARIMIWPSTSDLSTVPGHGDVSTAVAVSSGCRQTLRAHAQVYRLDDIHEGLILLILDIGAAPAGGSCRLRGDLRRLFLGGRVRVISRGRTICHSRTTAAAVDMMLSVVMYVLSVSISLFCG